MNVFHALLLLLLVFIGWLGLAIFKLECIGGCSQC
jgi:hypothetical protein